MIELFRDLPDEAKRNRSFAKGECVFNQGGETHSLVQVVAGALHLIRHTEHGQEVIIHRAHAGTLLAEAALFSQQYHCDCIAVEASDVILISTKAIKSRMIADITFSDKLLGRFAGEIMGLRRRLEITAIPAALDRVYAAVSAGMHTGTIKALAGQIHLSSESTNRALSQLHKNGQLTRTGRGRYEVNPDSLPNMKQ